jgi:hypothetical protein
VYDRLQRAFDTRGVAMAQYLRLARPYLVLLAIFAVGRWLMGTLAVPYEKGHHVFSLVILTAMASAFYGVFCRRWRRFGLSQAVILGLLFGLASQVVVFLATVLSYALGIDGYFNHPRALNAEAALPLGEALVVRLGGLVVNPLLAGLAGGIGWALGGLLPAHDDDRPPARSG